MCGGSKFDFKRDFEALLVEKRVPEKAKPYFMRHLESWGIALRSRPCGMAKEKFLHGYFTKLVHTSWMRPFQMLQALEAIRLALGVLLDEEWAKRVDWEALRGAVPEESIEEPTAVVVETLEVLRVGWVGDPKSRLRVWWRWRG